MINTLLFFRFDTRSHVKIEKWQTCLRKSDAICGNIAHLIVLTTIFIIIITAYYHYHVNKWWNTRWKVRDDDEDRGDLESKQIRSEQAAGKHFLSFIRIYLIIILIKLRKISFRHIYTHRHHHHHHHQRHYSDYCYLLSWRNFTQPRLYLR